MPRVTHFHISGEKPRSLLPFYEKCFGWKFIPQDAPAGAGTPRGCRASSDRVRALACSVFGFCQFRGFRPHRPHSRIQNHVQSIGHRQCR